MFFAVLHVIIMLSVSGLQPHSEEPDLLPTYILSTISIEIVVFPRASEELRDLDMRCICFTFPDQYGWPLLYVLMTYTVAVPLG